MKNKCPKCGSEKIKERSTFFGKYLTCTKCNKNNYKTKLKKLSTDLTEIWEMELPDYLASNGIIDAEGNIYVGCEDGFLYKLNTAGDEIWKANFGAIFVRGEMILCADGNIYKTNQSPAYINSETGEITDITFNGVSANDLAIRNDGTIVFGGIGEVFFIETSSNGIDESAQWAKYGCDQKNTSLLN